MTGIQRSDRLRRRDARAAYLFLAPWIVGMLVITIGPTVASLYLSFANYSLLRPPRWIGPQNYVRMLSDQRPDDLARHEGLVPSP